MSGIVSDLKEIRESPAETGGKESIADRLARVAFDFAKEPPEEPILYSMAGREIIHPGNLAVVSGPVKSGKSALVGSFLAAPMANNGADLLGLHADNPEGKAILHFDTEQSQVDFDRLVRTALRRAGRQSPPPWLCSYCATGWEPGAIWEGLEHEMERARSRFGGIHAVLIDGTGDMVFSINDETESLAAVRRLHSLAREYDTAIIGVLHFNPNTEKMRGHFGSQLQRKAETVVALEKDSEAITAYAETCRRAPIFKNEGPRFAWNTKEGMHRSIATKSQAKAAEKERELVDLIGKVWEGDPEGSKTWKSLCQKIQIVEGVKERTAASRITAMQDAGLLERELQLNFYKLTEKGKNAVCS